MIFPNVVSIYCVSLRDCHHLQAISHTDLAQHSKWWKVKKVHPYNVSCQIFPKTPAGWWFGTWILWLSIQLGMECHHPNWRTRLSLTHSIIFQIGRSTTNQNMIIMIIINHIITINMNIILPTNGIFRSTTKQPARHFTRHKLRRLHLAALRCAGGTVPAALGAAPGRRPAGGCGRSRRSRSHGGDGSGGSNGATEAGGLGSFGWKYGATWQGNWLLELKVDQD